MNEEERILEFQAKIGEEISVILPSLDDLRSKGISCVLITHCYDPMLNETFTSWHTHGDKTALLGAAQEFMWGKQVECGFVATEEE